MTTTPTAAEIASLVRLPSTTFAEAVGLIESFASVVAAAEVIKEATKQHNRTMAILERASICTP